MKTALFPGTFDPFTRGHESIVKRTLSFMDEVVIAIVDNSEKHPLLTADQRLKMISDFYANEPRVKVVAFSGPTTDVALEYGADVIVRGVRSVKDFEYEEMLASMYKDLIGIETILLYTDPALALVSSTVVREMLKYGKDISRYMPVGMKLDL